MFIKPFFVLKTIIGKFEVSTVNLRGRDDWFETIVFNNETGIENNYGGATCTMDEAWITHRKCISHIEAIQEIQDMGGEYGISDMTDKYTYLDRVNITRKQDKMKNINWDGTTDFEQLLNATDKANRAQYFLATREHANYNHELYEMSRKFLFAMYMEICGGDKDIANTLEDHMDNGEDVRYNLIMMFENARWEAQNQAELDKEDLDYRVRAFLDNMDQLAKLFSVKANQVTMNPTSHSS